MKRSVPGFNHQFENAELLERALTHRSVGRPNNERLEFLGDSVLGMVISDFLFVSKPHAREGDLSRMRARLVRGESLAEIAEEIGLGTHVLLGEGALKSGVRRRSSILADTFEALLGAIYLDGGIDVCRAEIDRLFRSRIENLPETDLLKDPKTRLQEWLQARSLPLPVYLLEKEEGEDHDKTFHVVCRIEACELSVPQSGRSRRKAEQAAAEMALQILDEQEAA